MKAHHSPFLRCACDALLLLAGLSLITPGALAQASASATAPSWQLRDLAGNPVSSDQFKGKVIIVDFWATWCPPCREEIPGFVELHRKYADKGLVIVGVSLDRTGPSTVKAFAEKMGMKYPVVMGDAQTVEAFGGIQAIPTTFVIDRSGKIVSTHVGYEDAAMFENEIKRLL